MEVTQSTENPEKRYLSRKERARQAVAEAIQELEQVKDWYSRDPTIPERLKHQTIRIVAESAGDLLKVARKLVEALKQGGKDPAGAVLTVAGRNFASRADLKATCKELVAKYPKDGSILEGSDAAFVRELLRHLPRGEEKAAGLTGIKVGTHPNDPRVSCFFAVQGSESEAFSYVRCVDNIATFDVVVQTNICETLALLLSLHPTAAMPMCEIFEDHWPIHFDKRITIEQHRNWVRSLHFLCQRVPMLTEFIFKMLIRRMVALDIEISKTTGEVDQEEVPEDQLDRYAQILDAMMTPNFEFMQKTLAGPVDRDENELVRMFFTLFDATVLISHKTRFVQFLFFYVASLRPAWTETFLTLCLRAAYSPQIVLHKRLMSLSYLASFAARASFLTTKYSMGTIKYLVGFARELQAGAEGLFGEEQIAHPIFHLFLMAVQAVCYALCFKAAALAAESETPGVTLLDELLPPSWPEGGHPSHESEKHCLYPVLESTIRPLTCINIDIAKQVCRSLRPYRPMLARTHMPAVRAAGARRQSGGRAEEFEAFFPFEPYRLRHSHIFLVGIYQVWVDPNAGEEDSDEGEFEEAVNGGFNLRSRSVTMSVCGDEAHCDADFTEAANVTHRGFIPSVGPSPAFRPREDPCDMSPLVVPMDSFEEDDAFSLPKARCEGTDAANALLASLLGTASYTGQVPVSDED